VSLPSVLVILSPESVLLGQTPILGLCKFFGLSNGYWLRAQAAFDTEVAEQNLVRY
jgi:plasmid maintenance system antidote protein VapI